MKKLILVVFALLLCSTAQAQNSRARVVATCGTPPTTYAVGGDFSLTQDTGGELCTEGAAGGAGVASITPVVSSAAEANKVLKASAGTLYSLSVTSGATAGFVLVFNATSAPVDGAVTPLFCFVLPAAQSVGISFDVPAAFSTGITASFSSTGCFTKTASATAFFAGSIQ